MSLIGSNKTTITVVSLATCANVLGYMDRVCISVAAPRIQAEFHFNDAEVGYIFGAFSLSYALFQVPWGLWADRREIRKLVAGVIFFWSLFTGLTAFAFSLLSMVAVRFIFGISEAALSPAIGTAFGRYVAPNRRSTAFGLFLAGGRIGGMIAPLIATYLALRYGWRTIFYVLAVSGLLMFAVWLVKFPKEAVVRRRIPSTESRTRLTLSLSLVALLAVAAIYTMTWQFYATWFPTYLIQDRGFSFRQAGVYASLPFLFGLVATSAGGFLSDLSTKRFGMHTGRRAVVTAGLLLSALLLYFGTLSSNSVRGPIMISLAAGAGDLVLGTLWASAVELGGTAAGALAGLMNCCSNLGAFASPVLIGWMLSAHTSWTTILILTAVCNGVAAFLWLFFNSSRNGDPAASSAERVAA
jgi:MFS transporter, ACS family, glucarate transporter